MAGAYNQIAGSLTQIILTTDVEECTAPADVIVRLQTIIQERDKYKSLAESLKNSREGFCGIVADSLREFGHHKPECNALKPVPELDEEDAAVVDPTEFTRCSCGLEHQGGMLARWGKRDYAVDEDEMSEEE